MTCQNCNKYKAKFLHDDTNTLLCGQCKRGNKWKSENLTKLCIQKINNITYDLSGVNINNLSYAQYAKILQFQNLQCPIGGTEYVYDSKLKKFFTHFPKKKGIVIDHDHDSGFIRGIIKEENNLLIDCMLNGTYGNIGIPTEITNYVDNPPAHELNIQVRYKNKQYYK